MYTFKFTHWDPVVSLHVLLSEPKSDKGQISVRETKGILSKYHPSRLVDQLLPISKQAKSRQGNAKDHAYWGLDYVLKHVKALNEQVTNCYLSTDAPLLDTSNTDVPLTSAKQWRNALYLRMKATEYHFVETLVRNSGPQPTSETDSHIAEKAKDDAELDLGLLRERPYAVKTIFYADTEEDTYQKAGSDDSVWWLSHIRPDEDSTSQATGNETKSNGTEDTTV